MESSLMQLYILGIFTISGILIGTFFDIFRILRKSFKTPDFITNMEDIIFWLVTGCFIIFLLYYFNYGEIRWYTFLGMAIGLFLYMKYISRHFITISVKCIQFIKKVLSIIFFPIKWIIRKIILKPISFIVINIKKSFQTFFVKNKNKLQKNHKKKKDFEVECRKI